MVAVGGTTRISRMANISVRRPKKRYRERAYPPKMAKRSVNRVEPTAIRMLLNSSRGVVSSVKNRTKLSIVSVGAFR